jgi:hypothetical protein
MISLLVGLGGFLLAAIGSVVINEILEKPFDEADLLAFIDIATSRP